MIHGWPDTHRLWDRQVAALQDRYRCVRFALPGFDASRTGRPGGASRRTHVGTNWFSRASDEEIYYVLDAFLEEVKNRPIDDQAGKRNCANAKR